ncbi:MAG: hypothetical protein FWD88_02190 [Treponema sp.]|nr:hypothetical protein [Treponema sp.]
MNGFRRFGIVAAVAAIGLSMTGCPTDGNGNGESGGSNGGFLGATLALNDWVYTMEWTDDDIIFTRFPTNETRMVHSDFGANGTIADGRLNLTMGAPAAPFLHGIEMVLGGDDDLGDALNGFEGADFSAPALVAVMQTLRIPYGSLYRLFSSEVEAAGYVIHVIEYVVYIFVDRDITVSRERLEGALHGGRWRFEGYSLDLRAGWNAVHYREEDAFNAATGTESWVATLALRNPAHVRWVLWEGDWD